MEAEELLSVLRRNIAQVSLVSRPDSAIHYVSGIPGVLGPEERLRIAYDAVKAEASALGSLPPSPPTIRARLALSLVQFVNRMVWWQTAASKQFATAMCDFAQIQMESQAEQHARIEARLTAIEVKLQELHKPIAGERP
jgi:hypothetical protein